MLFIFVYIVLFFFSSVPFSSCSLSFHVCSYEVATTVCLCAPCNKLLILKKNVDSIPSGYEPSYEHTVKIPDIGSLTTLSIVAVSNEGQTEGCGTRPLLIG